MGSQTLIFNLILTSNQSYISPKMPASVFQPYRVSQIGGRISPWKEEKDEDLKESIETCSLSSDNSSLVSDDSNQTSAASSVVSEHISEHIKTDKYWPRRKKSLLYGGGENVILIAADKIEKGQIFPRRPRSSLIVQQ